MNYRKKIRFVDKYRISFTFFEEKKCVPILIIKIYPKVGPKGHNRTGPFFSKPETIHLLTLQRSLIGQFTNLLTRVRPNTQNLRLLLRTLGAVWQGDMEGG